MQFVIQTLFGSTSKRELAICVCDGNYSRTTPLKKFLNLSSFKSLAVNVRALTRKACGFVFQTNTFKSNSAPLLYFKLFFHFTDSNLVHVFSIWKSHEAHIWNVSPTAHNPEQSLLHSVTAATVNPGLLICLMTNDYVIGWRNNRGQNVVSVFARPL